MILHRAHSRTWLQGSLCTVSNTAFVELILHPIRLNSNTNSSSLTTAHYYHLKKRTNWLIWVKEHYGIETGCEHKEKEFNTLVEKDKRSRIFVSIGAGNRHAAFLTNQAELILIGYNESVSSSLHGEANFPNKRNEKSGKIENLSKKSDISNLETGNSKYCTFRSSTSHFIALQRWYNLAHERQINYVNKNKDNSNTVRWKKDENNFQRSNACSDIYRDTSSENIPYLIDLTNVFTKHFSKECKVVCGCNNTIVYQPNTCEVIVFGANRTNSISEVNKDITASYLPYERIPITEIRINNSLIEWQKWRVKVEPNTTQEELQTRSSSTESLSSDEKIKEIVYGFNHIFILLTSGRIFACGSNTYGELALGTLSSPTSAKEVTFFRENGINVKKIAAGNSFSLFLTEDGRVYGSGSCQHGQLTLQSEIPTFIPLLRSLVNEGDSAESQPMSKNQHSKVAAVASNKLIRIKDIACVGTVAVCVSVKNEILLQGSWEEFGFCVRSPRILKVNQTKIKEAYRSWLRESTENVIENVNDFDIVELISGLNTLLIRYRNGCIGGLGANTEGELINSSKVVNGKKVNLATAFSATDVLPVLFPGRDHISDNSNTAHCPPSPMFAPGNGFIVVVDDSGVYNNNNDKVNCVHLPPLASVEKIDK